MSKVTQAIIATSEKGQNMNAFHTPRT
jgi:hypothetical protein